MRPPISEPPRFRGQLLNSGSEFGVSRALRPEPIDMRIDPRERTGPPQRVALSIMAESTSVLLELGARSFSRASQCAWPHPSSSARPESFFFSFERLQRLGIRDLHAAAGATPVEKWRIDDPMLAAPIGHAHARLVLLQDAIDLRLAETASLPRLSHKLENRRTSEREVFRGAGQHRRSSSCTDLGDYSGSAANI